jgi:hypothetical protein
MGRILWDGLVPDVMIEPIEIRLHRRAQRFRIIPTVTKSGVQDQAGLDFLIL